MANISGAIITYNEQTCIRRALENLQRFCNEIVIFDSFSTDDTVKIAQQYDCRVFQHAFDNHRDQKNRAIEQCENEWVFLLDADEYCSNLLVSNLCDLDLYKRLDSDGVDAVGLPRFNMEDGAGPRGWPDTQTRLFRNYVRHVGHPFHHQTTGNAKKPIIVDEHWGLIFHDKTKAQQIERNKLYYYMRPGDYKEPPEGAENMVVPKENYADRLQVNVYNEYIKGAK